MASTTSNLVRLPPVNNLASSLSNSKKMQSTTTLIPANHNNKTETFALHQSVLDGRLKQLSYFLKMGMKVDAKDKYGRTCLMLACLCDHEEYGLQLAKVLMKHDANINMVDSLGRTALFIAVTEKRERLFDYFIQNHASLTDFRIKDNDGNILLNHVAIHGTKEMLRNLIDIMVERHVELDQRNLCGYTALLLAIKNDKYVNAFELAKESQVSLSLRDNDRHFNALEWLLNRINLNKSYLYNRNSICSSLDDMLSVLSTSTDQQSMSNKNRKLAKVDAKFASRKEPMGSLNQYFADNSLCEHINIPDFATEYHKSRFVPPIYTPRISMKKEANNSTRSELISTNNLVEKNNDLDENMTLRELVQRLYETIYKKMADSSNQTSTTIASQSLTSIAQQFDTKLNSTANNKASSSKTNISKQRSNSNTSSIGPKTLSNDMRSDSFFSNNGSSDRYERNEYNYAYKLDTNIFDLESMRKTPKLIALQSPNEKQTTKEAIHKLYDMYDSYTMPSIHSKTNDFQFAPKKLDSYRSKSINNEKVGLGQHLNQNIKHTMIGNNGTIPLAGATTTTTTAPSTKAAPNGTVNASKSNQATSNRVKFVID